MENSDILQWWLIVLSFILLASQLSRLARRCPLSNIKEISLATGSVGATILLLNALFKAFTQEKIRSDLLSDLEGEGISALLIGSMYATGFSFQEISKLFPPSENLDDKTAQLVDRMLEKGISPEVAADIAQVTVLQVQSRQLPQIPPKERKDVS